MKTLFLDSGHSVKFPGANGEVVWVRKITGFLKPLLDAKKWNVVMVPDSYWLDLTSNMNLVHRISFINKNCKDGDWVLSVHGNSALNARARGVTTCYMGGSLVAHNYAKSLSTAYSMATGVPLFGDGAFDDRTGRFGRIGIVRDTRPMALLIEAGFVSNSQDMKTDPKVAARAIAYWFNKLT